MAIDNVLDIEPRIQYTASAAQTIFTYPFPITADVDIVVDVDGVIGALDVDYTVTGATDDNGGTVVITSPVMAGGEIVTLYRDIPIQRSVDFQQNGPFASDTMNDELDEKTLVDQQLETGIGRALRLPYNAQVGSSETLLAPVSNWLGQFLRFNDTTGAPEPATTSSVALSQSVIADFLFPQTTAEAAAPVDPTNKEYPVEGEIRRYGAPLDEIADARSAIVLADSIGVPVILDGGLDYVVGSSVTIVNQLIIKPGSTIKPSGGAVITCAGGIICADEDWTQKFTGAGTVIIGIAQSVKCDWFGPVSTTLASPNSTIQAAITATARGSTILFKGQYVTTPLNMVCDENVGEQDTITNRDAGKTLQGIGRSMTFRFGSQEVALGAQIILGNGEDDDLLTVTGVRFSSQPSRCNIGLDGITYDGNKANNSSGRCCYFTSVKDVHGNLYATSAAGVGVEFDPAGAGSSNVANFDTIISVDHGDDCIRQGGLGDPQWGTVHVGGGGGDGIVCGSGMMIGQIHSFVNAEHGVVLTGFARIGHIRVNDSGDSNILMATAVEGCDIGSVYSSESALSPVSDAVDAHIVYSGTAIGSHIGALHCDDSGTAAKRCIYLNSGAARNRVDSFTHEGSPDANIVHFVAGSENDGNAIIPAPITSTVAYAGSVTPDPYAGRALFFDQLTGAIGFSDYTALLVGDGHEITTYFEADGSNRAVTWGNRWQHPDGVSTTVDMNTARMMKWVAKNNVFILASDTTH